MFGFRVVWLTIAMLGATFGTPAGATAEPPAAGHSAPTFTYRLLNGKALARKDLRGHPYILWLVASWCSSCEAGSTVVGDHIAELRSRGVHVVQMRLAQDLGAPGPGLQRFQAAVGVKAASPNWHWGELTQAQTAELDPKGYADVYYLVNASGIIVGVDGNPAASWDRINAFLSTVASKKTDHQQSGSRT
jgi:hypothetical protein